MVDHSLMKYYIDCKEYSSTGWPLSNEVYIDCKEYSSTDWPVSNEVLYRL